jgi:1-hydroxycarotenoid 3,4-desaturase
VVIGAGIGGLVCAIELARRGLDVTVVERAARAGGKMREEAVGEAYVDSGPTVFTMRWVFDAIFEAAGARLDDHLSLRPLETLARHHWRPGETLDLFASVERSADAVGAFAGAREAGGYRAFHAQSRRIYDILRDAFLVEQQGGLLGLVSGVGLERGPDLLTLRPFETLWSVLGEHFRDPRLRQLYGRYATYCGSSPFSAPATLMLIAHVEQSGVWSVAGGMQRLPEALESLARSLGVGFRFESTVARVGVAAGRASGVTLASGEHLEADNVVANADPQALADGRFGEAAARAVSHPPSTRRSLSAVTWSIAAPVKGLALTRHNVFFSANYAAEFDDILKRRRLPEQPTVYICAQDRDDDGLSPTGPDRLLMIVNAPAADDDRDLNETEVSQCQRRVFDHLARLGLAVSLEAGNHRITTPRRFRSMFPSTGGALYGPATHGWAAAFRRPGAATRLPGLYLAGGSVHPGAGVPMAALSGRLAAQRLMADRTSAPSSRRAAMSGGISTP